MQVNFIFLLMIAMKIVIAENYVNYLSAEFGLISDLLETLLFGVKFKMDSSNNNEMLKNASDPKHANVFKGNF